MQLPSESSNPAGRDAAHFRRPSYLLVCGEQTPLGYRLSQFAAITRRAPQKKSSPEISQRPFHSHANIT